MRITTRFDRRIARGFAELGIPFISLHVLGALCGRYFLVIALFAVMPSSLVAQDAPEAPNASDVTGDDSRWQYYQQIDLPEEQPGAEYYDFLVPPAVFDAARYDNFGTQLYLGDLRLIDVDGNEVPYALRVRRPAGTRQPLPTNVFNRGLAADGASQLSIDLGQEPSEHNEIVVSLPGSDYRRRAVLEGSADNAQWQRLIEQPLVYFRQAGNPFDRRSISYPPSRFRYLRLSVYPDAEVDREPVTIDGVEVQHTVTVPGELVVTTATVEPREPTRDAGSPASAWILDLGTAHIPCETLAVEVEDAEFARNVSVEAGGAAGSDQPFVGVGGASWERRAGEPRRPMSVTFPERAAGRLRLVVIDYRNPPLRVQSATCSAAARQVVFARKPGLRGPLRLYYGNPSAEPPHYDLERNLPAQISPPPFRLSLGPREDNPHFVPEPKPLTERWPWLIYVVLGTASVVLALVLLSLGRTAVEQHDRASIQS
jgi:hypothetical protein